MARIGCKIWMEYGACEEIEITWGVPFTKLCKLKKDETVIFAFIVYKSKVDRVKINKKVHSDARMTGMKNFEMPFDMKRMTIGGFKVLVNQA